MRIIDGEPGLSESHLVLFQGCAHASALDLQQLDTGDLAPDVEITEDGLTPEQAVPQTADALKAGPDDRHGRRRNNGAAVQPPQYCQGGRDQ